MKAHYLSICLSLFFISCSNQDEENQFVQYVDVQYKYTEVYSFSEGLSLVVRDGLYGFVDKTGVEVIPCQFNSASSFKEGLALVKKVPLLAILTKMERKLFSARINLQAVSLMEWLVSK